MVIAPRIVIGILSATLLTLGLPAGPATADTGLPGSGQLPRPAASTLRWGPCEVGPETPPIAGECAKVPVPVDWRKPGGPTIDLLIGRARATRPGQRVGSLLFNPGGPGGGSALLVAGRLFPFPAPLQERFDLIGFDPRGVEGSSAIDCGPRAGFEPGDPVFPQTRREFRQMLVNSRAYGRECLNRSGDLARHVDTESAARDVEAIRVALGESRISWLGLSYGSYLGARYAQWYPNRVRTMVLDGAMDLSIGPRRFVLDEAVEMERTFGTFADWCAATPSCALHGRDVRAIWTELVTTAERVPIPVGRTGEGLDGDAIRMALPTSLILHGDIIDRWPTLAAGIAQAAQERDATILSQLSIVGQPDPANAAIGCLDFPPRLRGYADYRSRLAQVRRIAPLTGGATEGWAALAGCSAWPASKPHPWRGTPVVGAPPILITSSVHDPSTPLPWAYGLHRQISGSRLLLAHVVGHTGYLHSACARDIEAEYLVTGRLPAKGTVCGPSPIPSPGTTAAQTAEQPHPLL